ncbi:hypothetical protein E1293_04695 [Actinomadura darangshiensis]|uniref:Uncharacterized protein n=1 Tax=Actinomadura darangshiensis TaxID=705336 RepID=A0A4R5BRA7_9ACTN|nr:hypothetical protein [Actinomadura darangshiensis]TDD89511.1 hypothetical protein E1293_04695 [Actinomadura darangshiensis]
MHYGDDLAADTPGWVYAWTAEAATGIIDRVTTVGWDLVSEAAPTQRGICKKTITALLSLDE